MNTQIYIVHIEGEGAAVARQVDDNAPVLLTEPGDVKFAKSAAQRLALRQNPDAQWGLVSAPRFVSDAGERIPVRPAAAGWSF